MRLAANCRNRRPSPRRQRIDNAAFVRRIFIAVAIVGVVLVLAYLARILLLAFTAAVIAAVLHALAARVKQHTHLGDRAAIACVVMFGLLLILGGGYLFGAQFVEQVNQLAQLVPGALDKLRDAVAGSMFGPMFSDMASNMGADVAKYLFGVTAFTGTVLRIAAEFLIVIFVALYVAFDPRLYLNGVLALVPHARRHVVRDACEKATDDLHHWLLGQLVQMIFVGALTGIGLWLLGVPLALSLGIITGLLDFVPFAGPVVAAVVASLVALAQDPMLAVYTVLLFLAIQQVEAHVLVPLIQQWAAALPPAVALLSVLVFGVLFGTLGVLVATPLAVVVMSLVNSLYVERLINNSGTASR